MKSSDFRLLVGLGNPGSKFLKTRHNIGYMALQRIAKEESALFNTNKNLLGQITSIGIGEEKKRLLMPNTFMNESGRSIVAAMKWFDLDINQILVIVDDMDLPLGKLRFRESGSSGGHNGLRSVINHLGSQEFCRLRIGIGAPSQIAAERKVKTIPHVLGEFTKSESQLLNSVLGNVIKGLELIHDFGLERGSAFLNSSKSSLKTQENA